MIKQTILLLTLTLTMGFCLVSCGGSEEQDYTFSGVVTEITDHSLDVSVEEGDILDSAEQVNVTFPDDVQVSASIGESVRIWYDGSIKQGDPVSVNGDRYKILADVIDSGTCGNKLTWELDERGALSILGTGTMDEFSIEPSVPWYSYIDSILTVDIEDGVTEIGQYAFKDCSSLTTVRIPDSVTSIGDNAFYGCSSLSELTMPDSVTEIGNWVFMNCTGLSSITLSNSLTNLSQMAFQGCESLTSITIPASVTEVSYSVFVNCTNLKTITFTGDAPEFTRTSLNLVSATVYYPAGNDTWTEDVLNSYGGTITWEAKN